MDLFLGYDPGGNGKHGICILELKGKSLNVKVCEKVLTVNHVLAKIDSCDGFRAAGIDTFTTWSAAKSGWRASDLWLRNEYKELSTSVLSSNSTSGSMCINGALVGKCLIDSNKAEIITETHPKVGFPVLTAERHNGELIFSQYNRETPLEMVGILRDSLNGVVELSAIPEDICPKGQFTDHHFDALFSAVVAYLSTLPADKRGGWMHNLHLGCEKECLSYPFGEEGKVIYAWPEKPDYEKIHR